MVFYHMLLDEDKTPEIVWSLLSLATSMAVNVRFSLDIRHVQTHFSIDGIT